MDYFVIFAFILGTFFGTACLVIFTDLIVNFRPKKKNKYNIPKRQLMALKSWAQDTGCSVEEHIRQAINIYLLELAKKEVEEYDIWKKQIEDDKKEDNVN